MWGEISYPSGYGNIFALATNSRGCRYTGMTLTPLTAVSTFNVPSSFCTVTGANTIVPWLAASGPMAYTPESPPKSDEAFKYGRLMPQAFKEKGDFLYGQGEYNTEPFTGNMKMFWEAAKKGKVDRVFYQEGKRTEDGFLAPMAAYAFSMFGYPHFVLIQNGTYHVYGADEQPEIAAGRLRIHRGAGKDRDATHWILPSASKVISPGVTGKDVLVDYYDLFLTTFLSSAEAFMVANLWVNSSGSDHIEMCHYRHFATMFEASGRSMVDGLKMVGRQTGGNRYMMNEKHVARKYGPNYVTVETALSNIRLAPQFTSDTLVSLIDPGRIDVIAEHGARLVREDVLF
jgi:hypothetical protein